jgi:hypothetical protein
MGVIEDVRKVIQDTVAPDLNARAVKVDELEKGMDSKFQAMEQRFDDQRSYMEKRFDGIDKRFDGLERMLNQQQVINGLLERVRFLETSVRATPATHEESKIERAG